MKKVFLILFIIAITLAGIFLPYTHGDYDHFAVGISYIFQFAIFASLLLVPIGLIRCLLDFINRRKSFEKKLHTAYLSKAAFIVTVVIVLAAALGAFASNNRFSAVIIVCLGIYFLFLNRKKIIELFIKNITPYFFIFIPLTVIFVRMIFLEKVKNNSTEFAIRQCEQLIQDIESYKI